MNHHGVIGSEADAVGVAYQFRAASPKVKSCPLIGFGVVLFLFSGASIGCSAWLMHLSNCALYADVSLACGITFLILSLFSMYGGDDVGRREYSIIWVMVLGIVGLIVAGIAAIVNIIALEEYLRICVDCSPYDSTTTTAIIGFDHSVTEEIRCSITCYLDFDHIIMGPIYVGLAITAFLQGLIALILSISSCCTICSCCLCYARYHRSGMVLQSSQYTVAATSAQVPYRRLEPNSLEC